jgi:pilus assembly protein Flp/PilA
MDRPTHHDGSAARLQGDRGASLVEYALLVALIAVVCIGAMTLLGTNLQTSYSSAGQSVANAN